MSSRRGFASSTSAASMASKWLVWVLRALVLQVVCCNAIRWLAISRVPVEQVWNHTGLCRGLGGFVGEQTQLCRRQLDVAPVLAQAARDTLRACTKAFADMRWNCSTAERAPNFSPDLERGTRESAFVYALSAAAASHGVARACAAGDLASCSCAPTPAEAPSADFRWGGCGDNLRHGLAVGGRFADAPMRAKKSARGQVSRLMNLHNNEVGRQALLSSVETKCKCHGISGSCSVKTCWKGTRDLAAIAAELKSRYLSASKVTHRHVGTRHQLVPRDMDIRPVRDDELVYTVGSPDYCAVNERLGSPGTQDRQCNKTSSGSDSCDLMCCGRGYNPYSETLVERCHCKYHWCCYVTCKKCERTVERYVCK
ncbi:protein Wnt-11 [Lampetra fluviatilis]